MKKLALPILLLSGALVAGCGGSSSSSSVAAASSSTPSGATSRTSTTAGGSSAAAAATPVEITTKHDKKFGTILAAGHKELTVYLFEADKGAASACSGPCAQFWPPVTGSATASGGAKTAELGTITRSDGSTQVTYKGHPLYYFVKDKDDEDAYGQGSTEFGAGWYVLKPSGQKIDES